MKVYVAHTYGRRHGLSNIPCEINMWKSIDWGRRIILMGHNPFIPNFYHLIHSGWEVQLDESKYFDLVSDWIKDCDALFVAERPEWEGSGVDREIKMAVKLGKPVYYNIGEIPDEETVKAIV